MRTFLLFLVIVLSPTIHVVGQNFNEFNKKISEQKDLSVLISIQKEEEEKYNKTQNKYHLLNSRYTEFYIAVNQKQTIKAIEILSHILEMDVDGYYLQFGWFNYHIGANLSHAGANRLALAYSIEAIRFAKKAEDNLLLSLANSLSGTIHFSNKNYEKAKIYFKGAYNYYPENDFINRASMLNNLGLCDFKQNNYHNAYSHFDAALTILNKIKDPKVNEREFKIVISGNLGSALHRMGYFDKGIELLEEEKNYYLNHGTDKYILAVPPLIELLELYSLTKQEAEMKSVLRQMELVQSKLISKTEFPTLSEALFNHYKKYGPQEKLKSQTEIYYKKLIDHLNEKNKSSDELNDLVYQSRIEQFKKENLAAKNESENAKLEKSFYQVIVFICLLVFGIVVIFFVLTNRNRKNRIQTEVILFEKEREIESQRLKLLDLENKEKQQKITQMAMNLTLRKETEKAFLSKINELKRKKNSDAEGILRELQLSVSNLINIDKRHSYISVETDKVLKDFKSQLAALHPTLSKSDLEYCCYFRLNMSAKEIGAIHGQTDGSIRVLKNKIKNKLNLAPDQSLTDYLEELG